MADLLTHYAAARLPSAGMRDRHLAALVVVGTFLPDLVAKSLFWVLQAQEDFSNPVHTMLGFAVIAYAAALFLEPAWRARAWAALYAGGLIHIAVDLTKDNLGQGAAYLFYPFSGRGYEFGWINPENVIFLVPIDAALLAVAYFMERRRVRQ